MDGLNGTQGSTRANEVQLIRRLSQSHLDWVEHLKESIYSGKPFLKSTAPTQCELGKLLENQKTHDAAFGYMYKKIKSPHDALHLTAVEILKYLKSDQQAAIDLFNNKINSYPGTLMELFQHLEKELKKQQKEKG